MADDVIEPFDAADEVAVNNARRDAERLRREDADVIRAIMFSKKGRAWMLRQLDRCHINSPGKFVAGGADATAFNLGRESYGAELLQEVMAASVDLYMTAIKEQIAEAGRLQAVRRAEHKRREDSERGIGVEGFVDLAPPAGFPGHKAPPPPPGARGKKDRK